MQNKSALLSIFLFILISAGNIKTASSTEADNLNSTGWKLYKDGKYSRAFQSFKKAIEADKNNGHSYRNAGFVLNFKLNKPEKSIKYYARAIQLINDDPVFFHEFARVYAQMKKYKKSVLFYGKAISLYRKQGKKIPYWCLTNPAAHLIFHIKPPRLQKGISYLKSILMGDYEDKYKETAIDWLGHAYLAAEMHSEFKEHAEYYLKKKLPVKIKNRLLERAAKYYYKNEGNLKSALRYAKERGKDFWITKMLSPRKIVFNCRFKFKEFMTKKMRWIKPGVVRIPMPMNTYYQKFISLKSSYPYKTIERKGRYNTAVFDFSKGFPKILKLKISVKNIIVNAKPSRLKEYRRGRGEKHYFANLKNKYYDYDDPGIAKTVRRITGACSTPLEKAEAIFKWTSKNIEHTLTMLNRKKIKFQPKYWPTYKHISEIYRGRTGHCRHFSELFTGMCRSVNISARVIRGIVINGNVNKTEGNADDHFVVEIYDPERKRWLYVEPQGLVPLGVNQHWHVIFATDRVESLSGNYIDMIYLRHVNKWDLKNENCMSYRVYQDVSY